jgi:hypothetical protein
LSLALTVVLLCLTVLPVLGDDMQDLKKDLEQLRQQNHLMQQQLEEQHKMIVELNRKVNELPQTAPPATAGTPGAAGADLQGGEAAPKEGNGFSMGNLKISGEGGVAFFETGKNGYFPDAQFRVDEARLFLDAPLWQDVYFHGELDLITREAEDDSIHLGELYLDFEDVAQFWHQEHLLNVRAGQFYIPFGEEYQVRNAIDNPLISHSLSDLWGVSPGLELFGQVNKFSYALGVQTGGISDLDENEADKSVAGRLGYDPVPWLHLSASAMRTGDLNASEDWASALWLDEGFFTSIGSPKTSLFHADLAELDGQVKWHRGSWKSAAGYADYNDNDPLGGNRRDLYYYYTELVQGVTPKLYGAVRFSQIDVPEGYPLVGNSDSDYGIPTKDLWRLSVGAGYRFNRNLLLKAEYTLEHGQQTDGSPRNHEDMLALECAFKF